MKLLTPVLRSIVGGNGDALHQLLAFWASGALSMRAQAQAWREHGRGRGESRQRARGGDEVV